MLKTIEESNKIQLALLLSKSHLEVEVNRDEDLAILQIKSWKEVYKVVKIFFL